MTDERIAKLKHHVQSRKEEADRIMEGEGDGYDGADGARYILELCDQMEELIAEVERYKREIP